MDDEAKQLLREIRDLQREHLELLRANTKEASEINRLAKTNHEQWNQQSKHYGKYMVIAVIFIIIIMTALELMKRSRRFLSVYDEDSPVPLPIAPKPT